MAAAAFKSPRTKRNIQIEESKSRVLHSTKLDHDKGVLDIGYWWYPESGSWHRFGPVNAGTKYTRA